MVEEEEVAVEVWHGENTLLRYCVVAGAVVVVAEAVAVAVSCRLGTDNSVDTETTHCDYCLPEVAEEAEVACMEKQRIHNPQKTVNHTILFVVERRNGSLAVFGVCVVSFVQIHQTDIKC